MKTEIKDSLSQSGPCVNLSRALLDRIVEILQGGKFVVKISNGKHQYDSLEELRGDAGNYPKLLEIIGCHCSGSNYFSFKARRSFWDITQMSAVWSYSSGENGEHVFLKVKKLLDENKSPKYFLYHPIVLCLVALGYSVLFAIKLGVFFGILIFSAFSPLLFLFTGFWAGGKFSAVSLEPQSQKRNFWQRNKDQLFVYVVCVLLGGFLTKAWMWLTQSFK